MRNRLLMCLTAWFVAAVPASWAQEKPLPTADEVIARMLERNAQRQRDQEGYDGMRRYILVNERFGKRAEMVVRVSGDPDGTKHFEVVGEDGWKAAQKHVFQKMLESEAETSRPDARPETQLTLENYDFQMVGSEQEGDRTLYAIDVNPKRKEKYLFRGRIWVDAEDLALVRVDGNPAKNPSFWVRHAHFVHTYQKNGMFWFPVTTETVSEAFLFGKTEVTIQYFDYRPKTTVASAGANLIAQKRTRQ